MSKLESDQTEINGDPLWGFLSADAQNTMIGSLGSEYFELELKAKSTGDLLKTKRLREIFDKSIILDLPSNLTMPQIRKLWTIYGLLSSAYLFSIHDEERKILPKSLAVPLYNLSQVLRVPPILNYDGYILNNFRVLPGSINNPQDPTSYEPLFTFSSTSDDEHCGEKWFVQIHVAIERTLGPIVYKFGKMQNLSTENFKYSEIAPFLEELSNGISEITAILSRMPENLSPTIFASSTHRYFSAFNGVIFEGVPDLHEKPQYLRGASAGQSPSFPVLEAFLGIENSYHYTNDTKAYIYQPHRLYIEKLRDGKSLKLVLQKHEELTILYNNIVTKFANFRKVHLNMARMYLTKYLNETGKGDSTFKDDLAPSITNTHNSFNTTELVC